ncbi:MAG: rhodanese-like domain-containing protein [Chitinophagales bacterium]
MSAESAIREKKGTIIDVRTPEEFRGGHVVGSLNIPLQEIPHRMAELQTLQQPFILCCASGNRSGQAHRFLAQEGYQTFNGGPWMDVNRMVVSNQLI